MLSEPAPSECVAVCVQASMAQARAADAIERDCEARCDALAEAGTPPECKDAASAARKAVEQRPMRKRAPLVWAQLARAAVHCNRFDGLLAPIVTAGAVVDPKQRDETLIDALVANPLLTSLCPAGPSALERAAQAPRAEQIDQLIRDCPLDGHPQGQSVYRDLGLGTFAAVAMIRRRWEALRVESADHRVLLDTLVLSSALEAEAN